METFEMQARYRHAQPQMGDALFLADGGQETTLIFHHGLDLPHFASFVLLDSADGRAALTRYYAPYVEVARRARRGLVLETPTWRSNPEWAAKLGYEGAALDALNTRAVEFLLAFRAAEERPETPIVVSGAIGPRGDGYAPETLMSAEAAEAYHGGQVRVFEAAGVDLVTAFTITYVEEAVGIVRAAKAAGVPVVISFTVETDGKLRSGTGLGEAITACDAATGGYAAYYMVNCAHPRHFRGALAGSWLQRIGGIRANASKMSHDELDNAPELDPGDPLELAEDYRELLRILPKVRVLGGCCGTDHRHIGAISDACTHAHAA
jgi:homocysteine S-methyltransferase